MAKHDFTKTLFSKKRHIFSEILVGYVKLMPDKILKILAFDIW